MSPRAGFVLGILGAAGAAAVVPVPPGTIELVYSGLIYPPIQRVLTSISNLAPFALLDVLLVGGSAFWCAWLVRDLLRSRHRLSALGGWAARTAMAAAALYLIFLGTWGLNYHRLPLEKKLRYDAAGITPAAARDAVREAVSRLNALYAAAHASDAAPAGTIDPQLAAAFSGAMRELGASGRTVPGRPKHSLLDLYFRPAAVSGMTDPFFLETLVAGGLLPIERPLVIAHEWSHLAGFADEGEANFGGWLTCVRGNPQAQYSGWLFLFDELLGSLPRHDRADLMARLGAGPREDLRAIAARLAREVKPQISSAGWRVYDQYLKANRIEAGTASYAQVVRLVLGTRLGLTPVGLASPAP